MVGFDDIVITGVGAVTPIGIGREALQNGLLAGKCGSKQLFRAVGGNPILVGATIDDFDGKQFVTPRKALKLMSREVQIAYAAAHLAWEDAGLSESKPEPERMGVVFGSEMIPGDHSEIVEAVQGCSTNGRFDPDLWGENYTKIFPLWMLRNLPNMPACHVAIAIDARGPNNTIAMEEVSGLLALGEAICIMQRNQADLMVVGAMGCRVTPTRQMYRKPNVYFNGATAGAPEQNHSRAFDPSRCGIVSAELSTCLVLERRRHAVARNAKIYGQVFDVGNRCGRPESEFGGSSASIASAARSTMESAGVNSEDLAMVSAQGFSHQQLDSIEAKAIAQIADGVPVTAFSSYFGTAGGATGLAQLTAALLSMQSGRVLPILGNTSNDPTCPINICRTPTQIDKSCFLQLSYTFEGQAAAVVVQC